MPRCPEQRYQRFKSDRCVTVSPFQCHIIWVTDTFRVHLDSVILIVLHALSTKVLRPYSSICSMRNVQWVKMKTTDLKKSIMSLPYTVTCTTCCMHYDRIIIHVWMLETLVLAKYISNTHKAHTQKYIYKCTHAHIICCVSNQPRPLRWNSTISTCPLLIWWDNFLAISTCKTGWRVRECATRCGGAHSGDALLLRYI